MPGLTAPSGGMTGLELATVTSPIGLFHIVYQDRRVFGIDLKGPRRELPFGLSEVVRRRRGPFDPDSPPGQLSAYFRGERREFDVEPVYPPSGAFDRRVWEELRSIPYGSCRTYGDVARRLGQPGAARAVGGAAHRNPLPILVPCHRLVGGDRHLTGFGMGLWRKRWLLALEGVYPPRLAGDPNSLGAPRQRTLEEALGPPSRAPFRPGSAGWGLGSGEGRAPAPGSGGPQSSRRGL